MSYLRFFSLMRHSEISFAMPNVYLMLNLIGCSEQVNPYEEFCNNKCCGYERPFYVFWGLKSTIRFVNFVAVFKVYLVSIYSMS